METRGLPPSGADRRGDRVVAAVCAAIGAVAGVAAFLCATGGLSGPQVVEAAVIRSNQPGAGAELSVSFFGRPGFTKTSTDPGALEREGLLWVAVPDLTLALALAGVGAYIGWKVGSRLTRSGRGGGRAAASDAADYDDRVAAAPGTSFRVEPGAAADRAGGSGLRGP